MVIDYWNLLTKLQDKANSDELLTAQELWMLDKLVQWGKKQYC